MNNLIKKINGIENIIGIYSGRFQPMGKHHKKAFEFLQKEVGVENAFVVTSNKVEMPTNPFTFEEKKRIIERFGINRNNIIEVKKPYSPVELTSRFDASKVAAIYMVGYKDYARMNFTKKDGSPAYFQDYDKNKNNIKSINKHSYVMLSPHVEIQIEDIGEMSGTNLRKVLSVGDKKVFEKVMGWYDESIANMVSQKLKPIRENSFHKMLLSCTDYDTLFEVNSTGAAGAEQDDGPRFLIGNFTTYKNKADRIATRLGYSVIDYLISPSTNIAPHPSTIPPKGPTTDVSYFYAGPNGNEEQGDNDLSSQMKKDVWTKWSSEIEDLATKLGLELIKII